MRLLPICREAMLGLLIGLLIVTSSSIVCHGGSVVEVTGAGECADCQIKNIKSSKAYNGLRVTIDCKLANGEMQRRGSGELDKQGNFRVALPEDLLQDGKLKEECYAQLHSASNTPCPAHDGIDSSKIIFVSKSDDGKHAFSTAGKIKFSSETCVAKFFWYPPPLPKLFPPHPWFKKPFPFPKPCPPPAVPTPVPVPVPVPTPVPVPVPVPTPVPVIPKPKPKPSPKPFPKPSPKPCPTPKPFPKPSPKPFPKPSPKPCPTPKPFPKPPVVIPPVIPKPPIVIPPVIPKPPVILPPPFVPKPFPPFVPKPFPPFPYHKPLPPLPPFPYHKPLPPLPPFPYHKPLPPLPPFPWHKPLPTFPPLPPFSKPPLPPFTLPKFPKKPCPPIPFVPPHA
ncbi:Proline-rich protein 4-like protein [Drosera capensis]